MASDSSRASDRHANMVPVLAEENEWESWARGSVGIDTSPVRPRPRSRSAIEYRERRNSTMSRAAPPAPPLAVDVAVILTAIVRPEPDAGGYSASTPRFPAITPRARPSTRSANCDRIQVGMTEADIEAILGRPADNGGSGVCFVSGIVFSPSRVWSCPGAEMQVGLNTLGRV